MSRVLFVDLNAQFINPTRNLLPMVLAAAGRMRMFGPGYSTPAELEAGLAAFDASQGPFDIALTNTLVLFANQAQPDAYAKTLQRSYATTFPNTALARVPGIAAELRTLACPRVAVLLENDFYNWPQRDMAEIASACDVVMGFGAEFSPLKQDIPHLQTEGFAPHATDVWAQFVRANPERVASTLHFVGDGEFHWTALAARPNAWAVMGVQYAARGIARDKLVAAGIRPVVDTPLRKGLALLKRLQLLNREPRMAQVMLNADFSLRLGRSKYGYTCGSGADMPIRKFFEIPAAGAVLVCRPFHGFAAAGFADRVNCVVCEPQDIMEAHAWLEADPERAQAIADAGRALVLRQHSTAARVRQFAETFAAVTDGTFAGGAWVEGQYVVRRKPATASTVRPPA